MKDVEIDLAVPRYACADVREAWPRLRRLSLRRVAAEPVMLIAVHRGLYPVFLIDGKFHAGTRQGDPSTGTVAGDLADHADHLSHYGRGSWAFDRLCAMKENLVVVGDTLCERVEEPVWTVTASSNGNFRGDRPLQIRSSLQLYRPFRVDLAPSDPPALIFRADRKAELEGFVGRLKERHPYSTVFPDSGRCQVIRPEALAADDFGLSVRALARALVSSTHKALPVLTRAAVEAWTALRRSTDDPAAFARGAEALAPLLRMAPLAEDADAERWSRRARLQADMLALRLHYEPQLAPAEDLLAHEGPAPCP